MENADSIDRFDEKEHWRCPQLGGPVPFGYCRRMNRGLPCAQVVACWAGMFEIADFLLQHYSEEDIKKALSSPKEGRWAKILKHVPSGE